MNGELRADSRTWLPALLMLGAGALLSLGGKLLRVIDLSPEVAAADLRLLLGGFCPDLVLLQEWGPDRNKVTRELCKEFGYGFSRKGGGPVLYKLSRYTFLRDEAVLLARAEFVGHLPGRRPRLGANYATKVILFDHLAGEKVAASSFHLTADTQDGGGGYKKDPRYLLRVLRHRLEKHRLGKDARADIKAGRDPILGGDSNFHGMTLGGLVNCWVDSDGGSLGWRAVDIVFTRAKPKKGPFTTKTSSDHRAVCVTY